MQPADDRVSSNTLPPAWDDPVHPMLHDGTTIIAPDALLASACCGAHCSPSGRSNEMEKTG